VHLHYTELPELEFNIPGSTSVLSIDSCLFSDGVGVSDEPELALSGGLFILYSRFS